MISVKSYLKMSPTNVVIYLTVNLLVGWAAGQTICQTPHNETGRCQPMSSCRPLLKRLLSNNDPDYIRASLCGRKQGQIDSDSLFCCPPTYTFPLVPDCGENFLTDSNSRIVGGFPAKRGQFPWIAALGYKSDDGAIQFKCGGALVHPRFVVTAAHCIWENEQSLHMVRMGVLDLYNDKYPPIDAKIIEMQYHRNFSRLTMQKDIGLLKLDRDIRGMEPQVTPICLPIPADIRQKNFYRYYPFVAGWGKLGYDETDTPDKLMALQIPVLRNQECLTRFVNFKNIVIDNTALCAGYLKGGKDSCEGDSGGPLMVAQPTANMQDVRFYLAGVVSYGYKCAEPGFPSVYTRVTEYVDWLQDHLY